MVEFISSVLIFVTIMSAGLAYYRVMRAAAIRQEAARNLAFSKIDNSGTLTTLDSSDGRTANSVALSIEGSNIPALSGQDQFVGAGTRCFTVIPQGQATQSLPVSFGLGGTNGTTVNLSTYAVVCRSP